MNETAKDTSKAYEAGYLLVSTIPEEKVADAVAALSGILSANGATVIAEEAPALIPLAYEMRKASGSGTHARFNEGYFGWMKFECPSASIEAIRKAFEAAPQVLRALVISTVREKTYLGKRGRMEAKAPIRLAEAQPAAPKSPVDAATAPMTQAQIAAVDESIDEMVKGA